MANRLLYNFSSLGFIQAANFLLSLVVIPYLLRIIGADGFGVIAVAQVVIFYLAVMTDYGFNRTAIRDIALYKSDREKTSRIFSTVMASKLLLSIIGFVVLLILITVVPLFRQHSTLYLLAFSFVIGQAVLVNWFFQGLEKMHFMAIISLVSRLIFVLLVLIFIKEKKDAKWYLFFMGLGNIIAGIGSIYLARRLYGLQWMLPLWKDIRHELKEGWPVTVSNLSMTTCQYIGLFILRLFTNDLVAGYYSLAEKVYFAMKLVLDVFTQTVYPRVCQLLQKGIGQVNAFFKKVYLPFLGIIIGACAGLFIFSPATIRFLAGHESEQATQLLRMLLVAVIIVCLNIPACLVLLAGDHKKNYMRVFSMGTLVNIVANLLLARQMGATGTAVSVLITELLITAALYAELFRLYGRDAFRDIRQQGAN